jgi:hypothetical protein
MVNFSSLHQRTKFNDIEIMQEALELSKKICENQEQDGRVIQSKTTITCSRGNALYIETTAIAILTNKVSLRI